MSLWPGPAADLGNDMPCSMKLNFALSANRRLGWVCIHEDLHFSSGSCLEMVKAETASLYSTYMSLQFSRRINTEIIIHIYIVSCNNRFLGRQTARHTGIH